MLRAPLSAVDAAACDDAVDAIVPLGPAGFMFFCGFDLRPVRRTRRSCRSCSPGFRRRSARYAGPHARRDRRARQGSAIAGGCASWAGPTWSWRRATSPRLPRGSTGDFARGQRRSLLPAPARAGASGCSTQPHRRGRCERIGLVHEIVDDAICRGRVEDDRASFAAACRGNWGQTAGGHAPPSGS